MCNVTGVDRESVWTTLSVPLPFPVCAAVVPASSPHPPGTVPEVWLFVVVVVVVVEMAVSLKYVSQLSFRLLRHPH